MEKQKTKAAVLKKHGKAESAFEIRELELNPLQSDQVCIEVEAFGLNYADVMARNNLYREAPPLPSVIGYEVVGKIIQVGAHVDTNLLNKRVVAFTRFGGYAQHAITTANAVVEIQNLEAEKALALCTQFVTAYYMSNYVSTIRKGERVLIHAAAGGVGVALIQLAKKQGAIVYAKIGDESKRDLVHKLGADYVINYKQKDYYEQLKELLQDSLLDVSFNPVAGSTFKKDEKLLNAGGRLIMFGGSERSGKSLGILSTLHFVWKMGLVLPIVFMMKSKSLLGVNMLKIADYKPEVLSFCLKEVVKLYQEGVLIPQVGGKFSVEKLAEAHALLESGKSTGKISVFW
jgi:NADPH:quinone reductase-like Zn-dependent oxidoreductase